MTNEQKLDLLRGMLKAATLLKKCATMLDEETNTTHKLFDGNCPTSVSYTWALENMMKTIDKEIAEASGIYGDNTTPNYSTPTKTFVKNNEYDAWCDFYYGEEWKILTLVGRTADTLYFKSGNTIIRGEVRVREWDGFDVEYTSLGWTENGKEYETVLYSADI